MTVALIRSSMVTGVLGITPILHSGELFTEHDSSTSFIEFCERNPTLRRFYIRGTGDVTIGASNATLEWTETEIECAVCYPRDFHAGSGQGNDRDALIESDLWQIDNTIGTAGYSNLENAVSGTVTTIGQSREEGDACLFGLLRFRVEFWKAVP